jgi:TRAP-type C4-dicarboxylate transport system permease small subunit
VKPPMTELLVRAFSAGFGIIMVLLAVLVTVETIARKFFAFSLQGVDELGGYVLAVTSSLAFTLALVDRAHIRIDIFHRMLPIPLQRLFDWLSVIMLAAFAGLLVWVGFITLGETLEFRSTAPTPWATPLIWPQGGWLAGLVVFSIVTLIASIDASRLFFSGRWRQLDRRYGPKGTEEEVHEELAELEKR